MVDVAQRLANLSPAQRKLLETRLKKNPKIAQPIAVVGMSCRLPGAADLDSYWRLISERRCAVTEIPADRWDADQYYDSDPDTPGKTSIRWCAFVDDVQEFDAMFFGITPREAVKMDPQQRLLLEVTWEAFENAGIAVDQMSGSSTGVFVGIGGSDYAKLPNPFDNYLEFIDPYMGTGNALSISANRISYIMDLRGPSVAVDTACSSGSVALHLAIQSLRAGECDAAVAGAVNLVLSPEVIMAFSKARMLSMTGECRPFDAAANGYVRGEGCGILLLKRLTDATRDGDNVLAVIRGTAINQDGRTSGITAPNSLSQQECIRAAWNTAGVESSQISYIEAHGTGTPLGDPIEFQSLTKLFPQRNDDEQPVHVTSVKANVGHTETVSGIAGLIKVILMMRHGEIPGQAAFDELNPNIKLEGSRLVIPREPVAWTTNGTLLAGVSSFGFGGTNSHVIVESASPQPTLAPPTDAPAERSRHVLALSAKSSKSLADVAQRLAEQLQSSDDSQLGDFCSSVNTGRSHFNHRAAIVTADKATVLEALQALAAGKRSPKYKAGEVRIATRPKIAFLFTGQGAQYEQMGKSLYEQHPVFCEALDQCAEILNDYRDQALLDVMYPAGGGSPLNETTYTQPALFALEYALAKLWRSWGVEPNILLGHSVGEYVAACIAGVFSLEDGLRLLAKRAELMQQLPQNGKMAVIFAPRKTVDQALEKYGERVAVATANGPENNVISGEAGLVEEMVGEFEKNGVGTQLLKVSHAFHSPLMDPMLDEFESFAAGIEYHRPTIPIVANRTGTVIEMAEFDATYWRDHIRNAVEFATGMEALQSENVHAMVEVGPTASLLGMGKRCLPDFECTWVPSLRKARNDWDTLLTAVADLYVLGVRIDWRGFDRPWPRRRMHLPNYPFDRARHWMIQDKPVCSGGGRGPALHPLIGSQFQTAFESQLYEARYSAENPKHLRDHQVQGSIVVPGAAYIEQGFAAANLQFDAGQHAVENIAIQAAMFLPVEGHRIVQITASPELGGRSSFETYSISGDSQDADPNWQLHVTGTLVHQDGLEPPAVTKVDLEQVRERVVRELTRDEFYEIMAQRNLVYGPAFQVLGDIFRTNNEAYAAVQLTDSVKQSLDQYYLHPCLGDALMQCVAGTVPLQPDGNFSPYAYVPMRVRRARILGSLTDNMVGYARRVSDDDSPSPETVESNVYLLDDAGNVLVEFDGVTIQRVGQAIDSFAEQNPRHWLFDIQWRQNLLPADADGQLTGSFAILADESGYAEALADAINSAGATAAIVLAGQEFQSNNGNFTVRPTETDDYQKVFQQISQTSGPVNAAIHLWSIDCSDPDDHADGTDALARAHDLGVASALRLTQTAARITDGQPPQLWFVTRAAQNVRWAGNEPEALVACQSPLWGMGRVAAMEHPELSPRLIDLDAMGTAEAAAQTLVRELQRRAPENQIAYRGDERWVARLAGATDRMATDAEAGKLSVPKNSPFRLRIMQTGSFDALTYEPFERAKPEENQVELQVHATGLNFSDVLKALGLYPGITDVIVPMGIEASGIVTAVGPAVAGFAVGDKVMGVVPYSFASHATTADYALVKKPKKIDHEEASTIPVTFLTAYYALVRLAHMQPGERVLIHAGAGGVGQAAIQIAKHIGAEIFCTAGSDEKRDFLRTLGVQHVMNSRTLDFADEIREITNREGVDIVLNSLPGDAISASLAVLRAYGRFLEIGKTDIYSNSMIGLLPFQDNLSYFAIDLDRILRQRPEYVRSMFAEMMKYFEEGHYQPLPFTRFTSAETVDAYRYMAQRKNIGKVVVATDVPTETDGTAAPAAFKATKDGTYLITGGLGALGLQVAEWLVDRGAKHIALLSRRAPDDSKQAAIKRIEQAGAAVAAIQGDVAEFASLQSAVKQIPSDWPALSGVVHAAGVLSDGVMFDMDMDQLDMPLGPKVQGAWNLHAATKDEPVSMFVLFSSIACVLGSPGQSNYAAGNAYLDALATWRRSQGLPATSINWGPWANSGMATEDGREEQLASRGMGMLPSQQALDLMGDLITSHTPNTAVMSVNFGDMLRAARGQVPPLLKELTADIDLGGGGDNLEDRAFRASLQEQAVPDRVATLCEFFAGQLANIMGMDATDIDVVQPLSTMGLDSLMAIELKNKIETKLEMSLPMAVFMNEPSVSTLATYVGDNFGKSPESTDASAAESPSNA